MSDLPKQVLLLVPTRLESRRIFQGQAGRALGEPWNLTRNDGEKVMAIDDATHAVEPGGSKVDEGPHVRLEICGFGPVAAGVRASQLIAQQSPDHVILLGIAGAFQELTLGEATPFEKVSMADIGARRDGRVLSPLELQLPQWQSDEQDNATAVWESIRFCPSHQLSPIRELLTVAAASGSPLDAESRLARFPGALAEDMEGFSVALACQLANCPLSIIRGISNYAGDRNVAGWRIDEAMEAAERECLKLLERLA